MTEYKGPHDGTGLRIAIVSSTFSEKDGGSLQKLRETAWAKLGEIGASHDTFYCPGAFEIPTVCRQILEMKKYDAIVTLGVVVRGETAHFDFVCRAVTDGVAALGRASGVPVIFGVLATNTTEQAVARGHLGADYAIAAVEMANLKRNSADGVN